jgi:hypothetical protein
MKRFLLAVIGYICVGTVVSAAVGGVYLWSSGRVNNDKIFRMLALIHDVELNPEKTTAQRDKQGDALGTMSYEDIEEARKVKSRILELKMQSLNKGLSQVTFERDELTKDKERYVLLRTSFEQRLKELQTETENKGYADVRLIWENVSPKKAKEQILKMVEADEMEDVVHILSEMPIGKRAKIVSQFSTPEETEVMDKLLRMIREGGAVSSLLNETQNDTINNAPKPN